MASSTDHGSLVVSSNLKSTMKTLLKKSELPHVKNLINHSPWVPRDCKELRSRHVQPHTKTKNPAIQGGESVIRLSLGRRLVNLLPVAERTNAFTLAC